MWLWMVGRGNVSAISLRQLPVYVRVCVGNFPRFCGATAGSCESLSHVDLWRVWFLNIYEPHTATHSA